ncbi:hypothetical protein LINPERPRIM_LOCUS6482, partial [Linum perenne]
MGFSVKWQSRRNHQLLGRKHSVTCKQEMDFGILKMVSAKPFFSFAETLRRIGSR